MGETSSGYLARIARQLLTSDLRISQRLIATSGDVANASAVATLTGAAAKTTYITGFHITGSGATAGLAVVVTVTGLADASGTLSYIYAAAVGALVENTPLIIDFPTPLPASAPNTAIVVTCPALGTGAAHNVVTAFGYRA